MTLVIGIAEGQPMEGQRAPTGVVQPTSKGKSKVIYKEKSYYDFEDTLINGNLRQPDGSFVFRKDNSKFASSLKMKRSFIPELRDSSTNAR